MPAPSFCLIQEFSKFYVIQTLRGTRARLIFLFNSRVLEILCDPNARRARSPPDSMNERILLRLLSYVLISPKLRLLVQETNLPDTVSHESSLAIDLRVKP